MIFFFVIFFILICSTNHNFSKMAKLTYTYDKEHKDSMCVFRMNFGTGKNPKYFIWKTPRLSASLVTICKDLDRKIRNPVPGELFSKLAEYIGRYRVYQFSVDMLFESNNPEELVEKEGVFLAAAREDPLCLNTSFVPHIPKWVAQSAAVENTETENKAIRDTILPAAAQEPVRGTEIKPETIQLSEETKKSLPMSIDFAALKKTLKNG